MANLDHVIRIGADTSPVMGSLKKVEESLKRIQGNAFNMKFNSRNFTEPLGRITGQVSEFEKSLAASNSRVIAFSASAGLLFQITRAFKETLRATVQVEKSLADINVILNKDTQTLKKFGSELFKIASQTGQSFSVVAEAGTELARQGLSIVETQKRVKDALILTRLSGMSAKDSVESLTAALNTFSSAGLTSSQIVNKMARVDAAFAVSTTDLAEAIKRVGSTAQDVGVDIDQLNGLVTSLQQTTARGGSIIGNSLKTIFTRINRPETLRQLEALGLNVRDTQKNTLPAIQILKQLAGTYDSLSDAQKSNIIQTTAGIFQANIMRAALRDLAQGNSIYAQATRESAQATDEANKRNEELNKTLAAQSQRLANNLTQAGSKIGANIFGPTAGNFLGGLNRLLESGDSTNQFVQVGLQFGDAITKGIGQVLSGPGVVFGGIIIKNITKQFFTFAKDVVKQLGVLGTEAQGIVAIERNITNILASQPEILTRIAKKQSTIAIEASKVTQQLLAQREIAMGIAAVAPSMARNVARSIGTKNINTTTGSAIPKGFMGAANGDPRMFASLSGAINNEIRAGIPRTSIRLNSSSALSTSSNPMGLAITNLKDEPMGLRSLGIPNFADPARFTTTKGSIGSRLKLNRQELDQLSDALNKLKKEGKFLGEVFSELRSSVRSKKGSGTVFNDLIETARKGYIGGADVINPYAASNVLAGRSGIRVVNKNMLPVLASSAGNPYAKQMASMMYSTGQFVGAPTGPMIGPAKGFYSPPSANNMGSAMYIPPSTLQKPKSKPNFLQRNFPTFIGAGKNLNGNVRGMFSNFSGSKATGFGFAASMLGSTIAPDSAATAGINAGLMGGLGASMMTGNPYIIGLTAAGAAALAFAKKMGALDEPIEDFKKMIESRAINQDAKDFFDALNNGFKTVDVLKMAVDRSFHTGNLSNFSATASLRKTSLGFVDETSLSGIDAFNFRDYNQVKLAQSVIKSISAGYKSGDSIENSPIGIQAEIAKIAGLNPNMVTAIKDLSPSRRRSLFEQTAPRSYYNSMTGKYTPSSPSWLSQSVFMDESSPFSSILTSGAKKLNKKTEQDKQERRNNIKAENDLLKQRTEIIKSLISLGHRQSLGQMRDKYSSQRSSMTSEAGSFFLFGPDLLNYQQRSNLSEFTKNYNSSITDIKESEAISKRSAVFSASKSLGGGIGAQERDIFEKIMKSGVTASLISETETEQDKTTLRNLKEELIRIEEESNKSQERALKELQEQELTEIEITKLKKFKFDNELKQARSSALFESLRRAGDARNQFGIGAIGGAGLAAADQDALMSRIAVTGVRKGDYAAGMNIALRQNFQRNSFDAFQTTIGAVNDLMAAFKNGLSPALADAVLNARSASEAFAGLGNALSRMALERGFDIFFNAAFSKIGFKGFSRGGLVTGGSSANVDSVPAALSSGEFVLRRSAVNRIGVSNLNAINNGGFAGLQSGGYAMVNLNNSSQFLGNPTRPTGMRFNIDPSLSAYALTSDINRQNQIRDQRAGQYFSYRKNQLAAMSAYKRQMAGRRHGALIGAATSLAGGAIGGMGGGAPESIHDPMMNVSRNPSAGWSPTITRNSGGSIPSMVTRGEFVINGQAAARLGSGTLGRMNAGGSFNSGGGYSSIPSQENGTDRVVDAIKELKSTFEKPNNPASTQVKSQPQGNGMNISIPVSVTVQSAPATQQQSNNQNSTSIEDQDSRQEVGQKLAETIRANVLQEIEKQKRPGGILYTRT